MTENYRGLSTDEAKILLNKNGLNSIKEKKKNIFDVFLRNLISPVSLMFLAAATLSLFGSSNVDFYIIIFLFLSNFAIGIWHEKKADNSIKQLQKNLTLMIDILRDDKWTTIASIFIVSGDIIRLKVGSLIPADIIILESKNLTINESVLTGESLPKSKVINDISYSGSYVTTGNGIAKVTATGKNTFFGRTITMIDNKPHESSLEKDILSISKFIAIISLIVIFILTIFLLLAHSPLIEVLTLDLSLLIAGIPVALPTVMSLIISAGVLSLSRKKVIVRRLASLEDLANVNLLLSDKTGTLTKNAIKIEKVLPFFEYNENDLIRFALSATSINDGGPFDNAIIEKAKTLLINPYTQLDYIPGDSERKRSTAIISFENKECAVALGASQIIESLCNLDDSLKEKYTNTIDIASKDGYRSIALAINKKSREEENMEFIGFIFFADSLLPDAKSTVDFMNKNGIEVKMITGDSYEISKRIGNELNLKGEIYKREILDSGLENINTEFKSIAGFAEVLPKDKYDIVSIARRNYTVAMTGDGINDLPALKNADVSFAVSNAVDALKSAADIVLLDSGISVIKDSIIEARKIFTRLYNYSLYRISESFRIIITIAVIGLIYKAYPLTPVQLIVLAFLNDIPIISLAFDKVKTSEKPEHINTSKRFALSSLFGLVGTANSLILLYIMIHYLNLSWTTIQTVFFLKLTVSGHMLIYVAHTKEIWYKFLPSKFVIIATISTQLIATMFALFGFLVTPIPLSFILFIWLWSFFWMQVSELMKHQKIISI